MRLRIVVPPQKILEPFPLFAEEVCHFDPAFSLQIGQPFLAPNVNRCGKRHYSARLIEQQLPRLVRPACAPVIEFDHTDSDSVFREAGDSPAEFARLLLEGGCCIFTSSENLASCVDKFAQAIVPSRHRMTNRYSVHVQAAFESTVAESKVKSNTHSRLLQ